MSLFQKLKDKINYKIFKALDDPQAETHAAEQAQQQAEEKEVEEKHDWAEEQKEENQKAIAAQEEEEPSSMKVIINTLLIVFIYGTATYLVLAYGSMAANTGIHRHPLIRILYFIFGSLIGLVVIIFALPAPPVLFILAAIHIIMLWLDLLPYKYNFLPLIQYQPTDNIFYKTLQEYVIAWDPLDDKNKKNYLIKVKDYTDIIKSAVAAVPSGGGEGVKEGPK